MPQAIRAQPTAGMGGVPGLRAGGQAGAGAGEALAPAVSPLVVCRENVGREAVLTLQSKATD